MEKIKPSDFSLIQILISLKKPYYTAADFEKILPQKRQNLYVTLFRLVKEGVLKRLQNNVYVFTLQEINFEAIANQLYYPSYLSFESALSRYGIVSQIPYVVTFAVFKRPKKIQLGEKEIEFRRIKKDLFFGYNLTSDIFIAEPEKALLDQLYMVSIGKGTLSLDELDLKNISSAKLNKMTLKFPKTVRNLVNNLRK